MGSELLTLAFYLVVIVIAAEIFTNAVESLGAKLNFSEGVTGSIFAAVGTALPETMVPLVAIFSHAGDVATGAGSNIGHEVGVGAILGAPFMLGTLAMFLAGMGALVFKSNRDGETLLKPEPTGFRRDIEFFLFAFTLAFLVAFTPQEWRMVRVGVCVVLFLTYFYYVMETINASKDLVAEGHGTEESKDLYLASIFKDHMAFTVFQLLIGLGLIILGAHGFVQGVEVLSDLLGMSVMMLAILIVPVATELPEKVNSLIWIRAKKDTLALGNITGAMVFQGSLLPAIGIFLTPWTASVNVVAVSVIAILGALWVYFLIRKDKVLKPKFLILNGVFYILYVVIVLVMNEG